VPGEGGGACEGELRWVIMPIMLLDIVLSLYSEITAAGIANELWVTATSVIAARAIMPDAGEAMLGQYPRHRENPEESKQNSGEPRHPPKINAVRNKLLSQQWSSHCDRQIDRDGPDNGSNER
jgi:hypothetical protein